MHIVLAIDGSPESLAAAQVLARLPWQERPKLTVVTALIDAPYDLVPAETGAWIGETEKANGLQNFNAVKRILGDRFDSIEHVMVRKHPKKLILDSAKDLNADLIVLGARGHSVAYRVILGSTADYVANHAMCSVLIVRTPAKDEQANDDKFRVLLAYDGSPYSDEALRQLCKLDWTEAQTHLHIAMVLERPKLLPEDVTYDAPLVAACEAKLERLARPEKLAGQVKQSVREALHVGNAIRSLADDEETDLLFLGASGKSALARFFLGSTSRHILHHAPCSVWIARTKQWREPV